jgi:hypothetical protein
MSIIPKRLAKYMTPLIGLGNNHWQAIDVSIEEFGSLFVILPISDAARAWFQKRMSFKNEDSNLVTGIIVKAEFVDDLVEQIERAGLHITGSEQGQRFDWRAEMAAISKN